MDNNQQDVEKVIQERFKKLPVPIQKAIKSAAVEKRLRDMSNEHKLHLDQWQALENEVMLTLFGFQPLSELSKNIQESVEIDEQTANMITSNITKEIFMPIREELERSLEHPDAKEKELSTAERAQAAVSIEHKTTAVASQTPTVARAQISDTYKPGETSATRPATDGDPYRESVA